MRYVADGKRVLYTVTDPITALGFLRGQLSYLREHGYDVHVATGVTDELRQFAAQEGATLHDVPLARSWLSGKDLTSIRKAGRVLRRSRPDVLVYSTPKASLIWALACAWWRPPAVIYLLRGLRLESERKRGPGMAVLWACELLSARTSDLVVCVSHSLRERALELRLVAPSRAVVLGRGSSNGVDARRFRPNPQRRADMRASLGYSEDDVVVGFVGRLTEDKGVHDLIQALRLCHSGVKALFVGPTERRVDEDCLDAEGLLHVEMTKHVEAYYDAMDILVLPSWGEGMPNVLLEAQAMELPVITTTGTGCRDAVLPNATALLVKPRAPKELARVIDRLATHPEQRERMGRNGREHVIAAFDPEQQWARYVELFARPIAPGSARSSSQSSTRPSSQASAGSGGATEPASERPAAPRRARPGAHARKPARQAPWIPQQRSADHEREVV